MIILFACLVGWLDSLPVETKKKIKAQSLKTAWAYAWAGMNTSMGMQVRTCVHLLGPQFLAYCVAAFCYLSVGINQIICDTLGRRVDKVSRNFFAF